MPDVPLEDTCWNFSFCFISFDVASQTDAFFSISLSRKWRMRQPEEGEIIFNLDNFIGFDVQDAPSVTKLRGLCVTEVTRDEDRHKLS